MSDVPNDLLHEILRRTRVETLFRFRSVCKLWRDVIDGPGFAKSHINRGLGEECLMIRNNNLGKNSLISLHHVFSYPKKRTNVKNMGSPHVHAFPVPSCNGFILNSSCKRFRNPYLVWSVWNPFTGECIEIPKCDEYGNSFPYSGIGYDEANDDYKVVRIVLPHTYIYSLSLRTWRKIRDFPHCHIYGNGVFANGALHWVCYVHGYPSLGRVVALDLSTETYREIKCPPSIIASPISALTLHALGESLFLSFCNTRNSCNVWMMNDYGCGETWIKVISVIQHECSDDVFRPIAYLKSKDKVLFQIEKKKFMWYDVGKMYSNKKIYIPLYLDADEDTYDTFSYQVLRASLVRIEKEGCVTSGGTSKRRKTGAQQVELKDN